MEAEDVLSLTTPLSDKIKGRVLEKFGITIQDYLYDTLPFDRVWYGSEKVVADKINKQEADVFKNALKVYFSNIETRLTDLENKINTQLVQRIDYLEQEVNDIKALLFTITNPD